MLTREEVISIFEEAGVLQTGHFILTSGRHSKQYMQMAQVLQYANLTEKLCKSLAEPFKNEKIDLVVSPAVGGIIVGYEVSRILGVKNIFCERENGVMTLRRGFKIEPGQRVLVVEDVVTTGGSVKEVISVVEQAGGEIVGIGVLVDRSNGKVNFGYPLQSLLSLEIESYEKEICPLCNEGKVPAVKPGSRNLKG
ncbi:orotate phosphoribosyltransferase [Vulcanibacillus modesticaldus]|uniref:Orotate phosphoribosyltransferase n=1 Tax=Vulcanibacillus modesticaldus TaxID=337097 RepID=A0A1D2YTT3_9BACI|nr:orotate phosphoribosyltransferase [Vulcanibacillus modesticaldus]OEF99097.1 orotate phosphoribosyltransferase [Vulcanibacillus modesticaldus]